MAHGLEQLAHLAVAAFGDDDAVPVVHPLATAVLDALEPRPLAVDLDAFQQLVALGLVQHAQRTHGVLALDPEARVHQLVGQLAGVGEQQQALGVDVQPAHRLPLALWQARQAPEHGGPLLGVVVRHHLASRLVIRQHPRPRRLDADLDGLAVHAHLVTPRDALAGVRGLAVHGDTAVGDHLLQVAARADAGLGQHLVELGRVGLGRQHTLGRRWIILARRRIVGLGRLRVGCGQRRVGRAIFVARQGVVAGARLRQGFFADRVVGAGQHLGEAFAHRHGRRHAVARRRGRPFFAPVRAAPPAPPVAPAATFADLTLPIACRAGATFSCFALPRPGVDSCGSRPGRHRRVRPSPGANHHGQGNRRRLHGR